MSFIIHATRPPLPDLQPLALPPSMPTPTDSTREFYEALNGFACDPVNLEEFTNPVIDECGHTFDQKTIDDLITHTPEGEPIRCPLGREVIYIDKLIKNYLAKDLLEVLKTTNRELFWTRTFLHVELNREASGPSRENGEILELIRKISKDNEELKNQNQQLVECHAIERRESSMQIELLSRNIDEMKVTINRLALDNGELKTQNQELKIQNRELIKQESVVVTQYSNLTNEVSKTRKQIQNLTEMSIKDKFLVAFGPVIGKGNHLSDVMNRGLHTS